jgi:hypothetical protein
MVVHTLLRLLGITSRSSFHQCPTECMFSFENGHDIETISSASEFLGDTFNIWDVVSEEGRSILDAFIVESMHCCGCSLSIRSCLMFLIALLKS